MKESSNNSSPIKHNYLSASLTNFYSRATLALLPSWACACVCAYLYKYTESAKKLYTHFKIGKNCIEIMLIVTPLSTS